MTIFLIIIHVIVCIALIMIVLLQTGKGADMGAAFGAGSSNTLFGSTGASTFLSKATTIVAVVFMITCVSLAYFSGGKSKSSVMENVKPAATAPAETKTEDQAKTESTASTENTSDTKTDEAKQAEETVQKSEEATETKTEQPASTESNSETPKAETGAETKTN